MWFHHDEVSRKFIERCLGSTILTYPTFWPLEKENHHLQTCFRKGYVIVPRKVSESGALNGCRVRPFLSKWLGKTTCGGTRQHPTKKASGSFIVLPKGASVRIFYWILLLRNCLFPDQPPAAISEGDLRAAPNTEFYGLAPPSVSTYGLIKIQV